MFNGKDSVYTINEILTKIISGKKLDQYQSEKLYWYIRQKKNISRKEYQDFLARNEK